MPRAKKTVVPVDAEKVIKRPRARKTAVSLDANKQQELPFQGRAMLFVEPARFTRQRQPAPLEKGNKVIQEHAYDADVTNILKRYERTGIVPPGNHRVQPTYGDASLVSHMDYGQLQNLLKQVEQEAYEAQDRLKEVADAFDREKVRIRASKGPSSGDGSTPNADIPKS